MWEKKKESLQEVNELAKKLLIKVTSSLPVLHFKGVVPSFHHNYCGPSIRRASRVSLWSSRTWRARCTWKRMAERFGDLAYSRWGPLESTLSPKERPWSVYFVTLITVMAQSTVFTVEKSTMLSITVRTLRRLLWPAVVQRSHLPGSLWKHQHLHHKELQAEVQSSHQLLLCP